MEKASIAPVPQPGSPPRADERLVRMLRSYRLSQSRLSPTALETEHPTGAPFAVQGGMALQSSPTQAHKVGEKKLLRRQTSSMTTERAHLAHTSPLGGPAGNTAERAKNRASPFDVSLQIPSHHPVWGLS